MIAQHYNEKAQFHYYRALIAITELKEGDASSALNSARQEVLQNKFFTALTDSDLHQISPDLNTKSFYGLYGDYDYRLKSAWVPPSLKSMVAQHTAYFRAQFGDQIPQTWSDYQTQKTRPSNVIALPGPEQRLA